MNVLPLPSFQIRRVFASNLTEEFNLIDSLVDRYSMIAINAEYPGFCTKSPQPFYLLSPLENYELMKANINKMKIIQLGLALFDIYGNFPDLGTHCRFQFVWEFNFRDFNISDDLSDPKSIDFLVKKGINFNRNSQAGIDSSHFAALFMKSRLFTCPFRNWLTFHGACDLGYLVKAINFGQLPHSIQEFVHCLRFVLGNVIYDMKHMMLVARDFKGGLEKLACSLNVKRITGQPHQAGSDSLLTALTFVEMMKKFFQEDRGVRHIGFVFGLGQVSC